MLPDPELIDVDRILCARPKGLRHFIETAWSQIEPARRFQSNWHIDAVCDHLEAVYNGDILRLVINIPPGSMKSLACSVFWPAWSWTMRPEMKWITASFSASIARRDSVRSRQLMETPWYQARWGNKWVKDPDVWTSVKYNNDKAGFRQAVTVSGGITGEHGDVQLVDDPIKPLDASQAKVDTTALQNCIEWWDQTMTSRVVSAAESARVIIMQRLHERDLSGHVLKRGGYEHLMLPMRFEPKRKCMIETTGFEDPRQDEGELLWPERFPQKALDIRALELGSMGVAGQEQQRPSPAKGGIIKREWLRFYVTEPKDAKNVVISWDMTFKETGTSWCVGQVWWPNKANFYLLHQVRGKWEFVEALRRVGMLHNVCLEKWSSVKETLIEDAANGPAIISTIKGTIPGVIAIRASKSKVERLSNAAPCIEAGNVHLPMESMAPWVGGLIEELVAFPNAADDDQVDALSQMVNRYKSRRVGAIKLNLDVGVQVNPWRSADG